MAHSPPCLNPPPLPLALVTPEGLPGASGSTARQGSTVGPGPRATVPLRSAAERRRSTEAVAHSGPDPLCALASHALPCSSARATRQQHHAETRGGTGARRAPCRAQPIAPPVTRKQHAG